MKLSRIKKTIELVRDLPTLPSVAMKVNTLLNDPASSACDLAAVIEKDQSITAKILRLVNSAQYNLSHKVNNVAQAISLLGYRTISYTVMTIAVFDTLKAVTDSVFDRREFWIHSIAAALLSKRIAEESAYPVPEDLFTAGLLHDIGKVFMDGYMNEDFRAVVNLADEKGISFYRAENELFDVNHALIGEWIARTWQLPLHVTAVIKHHHQEADQRSGLSVSQDQFIDMAVLADRAVKRKKLGSSGDGKAFTPRLGERLFVRLPIVRQDLDAMLEELESDLKGSEALLNLAL
ncbi:MAG: HDOD domain-containing protein [Spirochaetota bacterium]